jgi:uncharacterized protein YbjT (DUF2867 family)
MILVAGATGALGSRICELLRTRGLPVRGLRRAESASERTEALSALGVELVGADARDPSTLAHALDRVDTVVSTITCFPRDAEPGSIDGVDRAGNVSLIEATETAGATRFVFVSFRPIPLDFPLQSAKRAVEARLKGSALDTVILRPGKFMDVWFSPLCGFEVEHHRATVFGDGTSPVTWIARDDVAEAAAHAAAGDAESCTVELGGPEALTQLEVIEIYERLTGTPWEVTHTSVDELERGLVGGDERTQSLSAEMLEAHLGSVADSTPLLERFPLPLTTVSEFAARSVAASRAG